MSYAADELSTVNRSLLSVSGGELLGAGAGQHSVKLARSVYSSPIAHLLREAIIGGAIEAGQPLPEAQLAAELSVSRGPVRQALQVLEGEGLVETRSNGRMVSTGFTEEDARDLLDVRFHLESQAVVWGVERRAPLDDVNAAYALIEHEGAANPRLGELDNAFHRAMVELSASRFLVRSWLTLAPVMQAVITIGNRRLAERDPQSHFERIVNHHRVLVDALEAGDAAQATEFLRGQFTFTGSMFQPGGED